MGKMEGILKAVLGDAKLASWVYRPHRQHWVETSVWITHQPILEQIFTFTDIWDMGARSERERGTSHKGEWNQTPEGETQLSLWGDFQRWPWWRVLSIWWPKTWYKSRQDSQEAWVPAFPLNVGAMRRFSSLIVLTCNWRSRTGWSFSIGFIAVLAFSSLHPQTVLSPVILKTWPYLGFLRQFSSFP